MLTTTEGKRMLVTLWAMASSGIPELPGWWNLTPWGLLLGLIAYVMTSVIRGAWVPRSIHESSLAIANKRGDDWKAAYDEQSKVVTKQNEQIGSLLEVGHVVEAVLRASAPPSAGLGDSGHVG